MLEQITAALSARDNLAAWSVRHVQSREVQLYAVPSAVKSRRVTSGERYLVQVLRRSAGPDGAEACGSGNATLLPGDDIGAAIDAAALMAGLVRNCPHTIAGPAPLPDLPLADQRIVDDPAVALDGLLDRLRGAVAAQPQLRLTAAELFARTQLTHLCNSRGVDAEQTETMIDMEWVVLRRAGDREVESFVELSRRRVDDIKVEGIVAERARHTADLLSAGAPPDYRGAVVLRGETLATFLNAGVIETLASAATRFNKLSRWEIGKPVFGGQPQGDPLNVFANRRLPFGTRSSRFDDEGLPGLRVELIRDGRLAAFTASQRYADYLGVAPTGDMGNLELPAGATSAAELLAEPHVEISAFSWFNPDTITGDFSSEIRLGYLVEGGRRTPFKGGALVGNVVDALANVRWSAETCFYGDYQGPTTARFGSLTVAGAATNSGGQPA